MFLISTVTITDVYQIHNTGILGWIECHLWNSEFVYFGLFVSSTWNIVVLTIERFVTVRNQVAKVMFLHVSVILFTGEGVLSQHALQVVSQHALQQGTLLPDWGACSGGCLLWGRSAPRGVHAWGGVETPHPEADGYCCRQYASYLNAFLFLLDFLWPWNPGQKPPKCSFSFNVVKAP